MPWQRSHARCFVCFYVRIFWIGWIRMRNMNKWRYYPLQSYSRYSYTGSFHAGGFFHSPPTFPRLQITRRRKQDSGNKSKAGFPLEIIEVNRSNNPPASRLEWKEFELDVLCSFRRFVTRSLATNSGRTSLLHSRSLCRKARRKEGRKEANRIKWVKCKRSRSGTIEFLREQTSAEN